jgi:hypothetical protein
MGHDMKAMGSMPLMPGMLTRRRCKPGQSQRPGIRPSVSDRMINTIPARDHGGGFFDTAGAGQDNVLYDFATDMDNAARGNRNHEEML